MRVQAGCAAVLGVVMAAAGAQAQVANASSGQENHALDTVEQRQGSPDRMFVKKAIRGNNGEIDAAKLALTKSSNDQVKQFAQKMVDDHTKMLEDLHQVAQQESIKYMDKPSATGMQLHTKLEGLSGAAFDKAYIDGMVKDHQGDVRDFTKESTSGTDEATKDAATKSLPTIKEHLQMVEGLQRSMAS